MKRRRAADSGSVLLLASLVLLVDVLLLAGLFQVAELFADSTNLLVVTVTLPLCVYVAWVWTPAHPFLKAALGAVLPLLVVSLLCAFAQNVWPAWPVLCFWTGWAVVGALQARNWRWGVCFAWLTVLMTTLALITAETLVKAIDAPAAMRDVSWPLLALGGWTSHWLTQRKFRTESWVAPRELPEVRRVRPVQSDG